MGFGCWRGERGLMRLWLGLREVWDSFEVLL